MKYDFNETEITVIIDNNDLWFPGVEVCKILEYNDSTQAIRKLHLDEKKLNRIKYGSGQHRKVWMVNESGLYALILRSEKPKADEFRRWVTHEVLPSIRKTGQYGADNDFEKKDERVRAIKKAIDGYDSQIHELQSKRKDKYHELWSVINSDPEQLQLEFN